MYRFITLPLSFDEPSLGLLGVAEFDRDAVSAMAPSNVYGVSSVDLSSRSSW